MAEVLGVRIDEFQREEVLHRAVSFLSDGGQHTIFTPNPEMLVMARKYPWFREILNKGDLNLCDGIGTALVAKTKRIPGVDFMLDLCHLAEQRGESVYLLGSGENEIVTLVSKKLQVLYPNLIIAGTHPGPQISLLVTRYSFPTSEENNRIIQDILTKAPHILLVAFGHGKQEWWISEFLKDLPSVKIAMGVGGAFDMLAGKQKRAPKWLQKIGFEWLWRLIIEPKRWKRIWTAVIVFPILAFFKTPVAQTFRSDSRN